GRGPCGLRVSRRASPRPLRRTVADPGGDGPDHRRLLRSVKASAARPSRRRPDRKPSCEHAAVATAVGEDSELQIRSEPRKRQRWWERVSPTGVGVLVATVVAIFSTRGAWGALPPHGEDVMAYLVRADFALPQLVAHGRLDGWFPRFYFGYQEFLFNGPGVTWAMAGVRGVTFGALSNAGALKVVGVLS